MPATMYAKNKLLNYNFGATSYSAITPVYFGLAITTAIDSSFVTVIPTALSYNGSKVVTLTVANNFTTGNTVVVAGVNAAFTVTNVDGTWVLTTANATTLVFTVTNQPTGTTPQTLTGGTVSKYCTEPSGNGYARKNYTNNKTTWGVSSLGTLVNAINIVFPECTPATWGTALSIFIADAAANGNIWWYDTLVPSLVVQPATIITFEAGSIVVSI